MKQITKDIIDITLFILVILLMIFPPVWFGPLGDFAEKYELLINLFFYVPLLTLMFLGYSRGHNRRGKD